MDSTMQLLNSSNVSSELIDGQSGRGIISSSFRLNEAQVSIPVKSSCLFQNIIGAIRLYEEKVAIFFSHS